MLKTLIFGQPHQPIFMYFEYQLLLIKKWFKQPILYSGINTLPNLHTFHTNVEVETCMCGSELL
jgi:hypothetical protein